MKTIKLPSYLFTLGNKKILFDFGIKELEEELIDSLDYIFISHYHYDPSCGLLENIEKIPSKCKVYIISYSLKQESYGRFPGVKIEMDTISNTGNILGESYVCGLIGNGTSQDGKGSVIKNSTSSSKVEAKHTIGGIAGYLNFITVDTCSNLNSNIVVTSSYDVLTDVYIGGYCGVGSDIKNVTNEVDITYDGVGAYIGGIVGKTNGNLTSCINKGDVVASNSSLVGGIAGSINSDRDNKSSDLTNEGNISGKDSVGGVIGDYIVEILGLKDNDTYLSTLDKIVNKGNITVSGTFGGVIAHVKGDARNEYLRYPSVKIAITNIENYGDICDLYKKELFKNNKLL